MTHTFAIFRLAHELKDARIDDDPPGMLRPMDLRRGLSVKRSFPKHATCPLRRRVRSRRRYDFFPNVMGHLIVNERARAVLFSEPRLSWEWYPLTIVDAHGAPVSTDYGLAHLLEQFECVDRRRSDYVDDAMEPTEVHTFHKLVLARSKVPNRSIFRLAEQPGTIILRHDLGVRLAQAGLTGWESWKLGVPIFL